MTTSAQGTVIVRIPQAPPEYNSASYNNIIRIIEENFRLLSSIGLLRGGGIFLLNPPIDGTGLGIGEVYVDGDGFLKMVQEGDAFTASVEATGALGTLTVSTP